MNRYFSKKEIKIINKLMKKCSTWLAIGEMQVNTMRYYLTLIRPGLLFLKKRPNK